MSLLSAAAAAAVSVSRSVRPNKILSNLLGQNFKTHTKNCLVEIGSENLLNHFEHMSNLRYESQIWLKKI